MNERDRVNGEYIGQDMSSGTRRKAPKRIFAGDTREFLKRKTSRDLTERNQELRTMEEVVDMYDLWQFLIHGIQPRNDRLEVRVVEKPKQA